LKRLLTTQIFFYLTVLTSFGQAKSVIPDTTFYLYYGYAGLGSGLGSFQPTIIIRGTNFVYTYEQNSYWGEKSKEKDTICVKAFRQTSIDSILAIVKDLKDTKINEYNHCIMSGGIHFLSISNGKDTTNFELMNTFDYTALKVADILNQYAPTDKKLWVNEKMITDAQDCWTGMVKRWAEEDKKKKRPKRKKNGT